MSDQIQVTVEHLPNRHARLTIIISDTAADPILRKTAKKIEKEIRLPGFRPGKVPFEVIVQRVGRTALVNEALDEFFETFYPAALQQAQLEPFDKAQLMDFTGAPVSLVLVVPLKPLVELGNYREYLHVPRPRAVVTEEEIEAALGRLRESFTVWTPVERTVEPGDQLTLDIRGVVGEEEVINRTGWEYDLTDDQSVMLPGLNAAMVGMAVGETRTFDLSYPADSTSRWAGRDASFTVTLHAIKAQVGPSDQELAEQTGDFPDFEAMRRHLTLSLTEHKQEQLDEQFRETVFGQLIENVVRIEYCNEQVEEYTNDIVQEHEESLRRAGMDMKAFLERSGQTAEQLRDRLRPVAEARLKRYAALDALAAAEGLEVTPQDIKHYISLMMDDASTEAVERFGDTLQTPAGQHYAHHLALRGKATARLWKIAEDNAADDGSAGAPAEETATAETAADDMAADATAADETA